MRIQLLLVAILMNILFSTASFGQQIEEGITVIEVSSTEDDRIYYMDAVIETRLPEYIVQAIYNGIPLPLLLQIEVNELNNWWLDKTLVTIEQQYILHYFPLFDSFRLDNLTDGSSVALGSFNAVFNKIGTINHFPILDKEHFSNSHEITARIRLKVDETGLPKPLRTESLLGGSWDISSDWKEWVVR